EMAELTAVGTSRVQAYQRDALAGLLEIQAMRPPAQVERHISADEGLELGRHQRTPTARRRGAASKSLKYCRLASSGCRSPSMRAAPRLVSASRSCQPGSGMGSQKLRQASAVALIWKREERIRIGPRSHAPILPPVTVTKYGGDPSHICTLTQH